MNILQVMNGFADRWNANGYHALALAAAQRDLGHTVICVADPGCRFAAEARRRDLPVAALTVDTDNPGRYFGIRRRISATGSGVGPPNSRSRTSGSVACTDT